jgi:translation initiation factor eIF-2B subunit beta
MVTVLFLLPILFCLDSRTFKDEILSNLSGIESELEDLSAAISQQVIEYIHKGDAILTCSRSKSILDSLIYAKKSKKEFQVVVAEGAPLYLFIFIYIPEFSHIKSYTGQDMAVQLLKNKIETTLISDSSVAAIMPRTNLVLIGTLAGFYPPSQLIDS